MAFDRGVDPHCENVLVVLGEDAGIDHVAVVAGLARVDVDAADDTGGAGLDVDAAGEVELVGEDVLVVGEGDDELDYKFSASGDYRSASAPVGVLPFDAVVLLVETDDVGLLLDRAV